MTDVWVLIAGWDQLSGAEVLGVYSSEDVANRVLELIQATDPSKTVVMRKSRLDAFK